LEKRESDAGYVLRSRSDGLVLAVEEFVPYRLLFARTLRIMEMSMELTVARSNPEAILLPGKQTIPHDSGLDRTS
jgi:hypothetical protein